MITLTDDEQATALRAARYVLKVVERQADGSPGAGATVAAASVAQIKRVIGVLEHKNDNGMWRCLCPNPNPWRHPTCLVCPTCGAAVPT